LHHHRRQNVRDDVIDQHRQRAVAAHAGRFDIAQIAPHVHFAPRETAVERQVDDHGRQDDVQHGVAQCGDDAHGEHEQGESHDGVHHAPDDPVAPAAEISCGRAERETANERKHDGRDCHAEIEPGGHHHAAEDVAAERVGAEEMGPTRRRRPGAAVGHQRIVRCQRRPESRAQQEKQQQRDGGECEPVLAERVADVAGEGSCVHQASKRTRGSMMVASRSTSRFNNT
jgi:hypothetical protein